MAEHTSAVATNESLAPDQQVQISELRRLYALHDPAASPEDIEQWVEEAIDANDNHGDSYDDQIGRLLGRLQEHGPEPSAKVAVIDEPAPVDDKVAAATEERLRKNTELLGSVDDLVDNLEVTRDGRIRYALGAVAMEGNVGGRFAKRRWLEEIAAHADEIREGLADRNELVELPDDAPTPETKETAKPLVISFIDQTHDALAAARDAAEARRRDELQTGGRFKRFVKHMWMGENGLAGAYYLEKYKKEALADITVSNDVLVHESRDSGARVRAQLATIERFQSEYDESIHEDAGEKRTELDDDTEFNAKVKELITSFVNGDITDSDALQAERDRVLQQLADDGKVELIGDGKVRIDNLVAIASQVKAMVDHGESLDAVLDGMKIYSGEARSNVRTEAQLGKVERTIDRLQRSKLGGLVGPETIGVAAAVGLGVARVGRGTLLRAVGVTVAPGVLGGAFAAIRESKRLKQERALHAREMAQGKQYETGKRRDEIEATRYETVAASDATQELEAVLTSETATPGEVQDAYERLALIEARIRLSDSRNIDLISYSDAVSVEEERQRLDVARATAKRRLAGKLGELPEEFRERFAINDDQTVNEALSQYTDAVTELDKEVDAKDKAYRSLRRRRVAKAAAIGAGTSLVFGLGAQEIAAFASPSYDGLAEHLAHGGAPSSDGRQTVLEAIVHHDNADVTSNVESIPPSSEYHSYSLGGHANALELPSNYTLTTHGDGTLSIEAPEGGQSIDGLTVDKHGAFTAESVALLKQHDVGVSDTGHVVEHQTSASKQLSVAEYNHAHAKDTTHIKRDFWYDNNTAKFDKNELGLEWGDSTKSGDIQMNVSHMTADGSYHNIEHTSWSQDAQDGKLKLAISGSRGTQSEVYMVDVKSDGTIDIPKDSPASAFFSVDNGKAEFHGGYAEVVEVRGDSGGNTHVAPLATAVGDNSVKHVTDAVTSTSHEFVPHMKLTPPATEIVTKTVASHTVEGFGMPGFVPRRPLERIRQDVKRGYYYNGEMYRDKDLEKRWLSERSPRLSKDSDAHLNTGVELAWYRRQQKKMRGAEYVAEIDRYIDNSEVLRGIDDKTKAIVCIPVAGANESENIYRTLSMLGRQEAESQKEAVVLLNVNWRQSQEEDPVMKAKIDKTLSEIKRAQKDFPNLKIASFEKRWSDTFVDSKKGRIYGEVIKVLYDTAALAMERSIERGRRSAKTEALLITNDADTEGMSRLYLTNYIKALERNPEQDTFTGMIRRGTRAYKDYPGYAMVANFYANTSAAKVHHQIKGSAIASTDGPNSAFRMSMYAAMGGVESNIGGGADGALVHRAWLARFGSNGSSRSRQKKPRYLSAYVSGAAVDTMPDRLLGAYRRGHWIARGWDGFDDDGYESRETVAERGFIGPENPETDINAIAQRIETSIDGFASHWWREPSVIALSLRTTFGPQQNKQGEKMYTYEWDMTKRGDGAFVFHFTDKGKEELKKRMLFDRKGNPSQLGDRMRHQLYGQLKSDKQSALLS